MAWSPSEDQVDEVTDAFEYITGTENATECPVDKLADLMYALGMNPDADQLATVTSTFSGGVKLDAFLAHLKSKRGDYMDNIEEVTEAFRVFDKDGAGIVSKKALKKTMTTVGEKLADEEVDEFFNGVASGREEGDRLEYEAFITEMSAV